MTRGKTPSSAASLHEQTVRHHCRALKMPTVAGQFETLAQAAIREGHGCSATIWMKSAANWIRMSEVAAAG